MSADTVFQGMKDIVEAPGFGLLTAYRDDLYKHDLTMLRETHTPGSRYLWIVREMGTCLVHLGIHQKIHDMARAVLRYSEQRRQVFLIERDRLRPISDERALTALIHCKYQVVNDRITRNPIPTTGPLAVYTVELRWTPGPSRQLEGCVRYRPASRIEPNLEDLIALNEIASCLVVHKSGSLFTPTAAVYWGVKDLREMIVASRRAPQLVELWHAAA